MGYWATWPEPVIDNPTDRFKHLSRPIGNLTQTRVLPIALRAILMAFNGKTIYSLAYYFNQLTGLLPPFQTVAWNNVSAYSSANTSAYISATISAYISATVSAYISATISAYISATVSAYISANISLGILARRLKYCGALQGAAKYTVYGIAYKGALQGAL